MDTRVYIITHKPFDPPKVEGYIPLQVGREGNGDIGYLCDNTGDHISEKNSSYCELTGLYWMWKNVSCDIIGLVHYRRYFVLPGEDCAQNDLANRVVAVSYIEEQLKDYDILSYTSGKVEAGTNILQYDKYHHLEDLLLCGEVIKEKYPNDYAAFIWMLESSLLAIGNMFVMRKSLMDEYCEWLFDILFEVEKRIDVKNYDFYQKRVFGFLAERLFKVWMLNRPVRVHEENVIMVE